MIKILAQLAQASDKGVSLLINKVGDDKLSIAVMPQGNFDGDKAPLATPLQVTGTVEELEAGFADALAGYQSARTSLAEQLADTVAVLEAAKKESADKAKKALTKSAPAGKAAPKTKAAPASTSTNDDPSSDEDPDDDATGEEPASAASVTPVQPAAKKTDSFSLEL